MVIKQPLSGLRLSGKGPGTQSSDSGQVGGSEM